MIICYFEQGAEPALLAEKKSETDAGVGGVDGIGGNGGTFSTAPLGSPILEQRLPTSLIREESAQGEAPDLAIPVPSTSFAAEEGATDKRVPDGADGGAAEERAKRRRRVPCTYKDDEMDNEQLKMLQQAVDNSRMENAAVDVDIEEGGRLSEKTSS